MASRIGHRGAGVLDGEALAGSQRIGVLDGNERLPHDVGDLHQVGVRVGAELAFVGLGGGDDHQLLHPPLEQAAGVDAVPKAGEGAQDLRPQAHRLDHLDRRSAALPETAALIERVVLLDSLEG